MKALLGVGAAATVCASLTLGLLFSSGRAADPAAPAVRPPAKANVDSSAPLIVHEWGTFTSFAGADGVPVHFQPNNLDLPRFVYYQEDLGRKGATRFLARGTVSMETPVIYFYTDRPLRASVKVGFPLGWITEWYPYASAAPAHRGQDVLEMGQDMRWDVQLLPGETGAFPHDENVNRYFDARSTESVPLQTELRIPPNQQDDRTRGGKIVQQEKFLFYRGVGTFPPPVTVLALGKGQVRIRNAGSDNVARLILIQVHGGKVGWRTLGNIGAKGEVNTTLPEADGTVSDLREELVKELTAAGLYASEAHAMVKTWNSAWAGEEGTRLLYLVPRSRTDELLPLTIDPKPTSIVRVLVGRHDFLTPEQEDNAEQLTRRSQAAQAELAVVEKEMQRLGRFGPEARRLAELRAQQKISGAK